MVRRTFLFQIPAVTPYVASVVLKKIIRFQLVAAQGVFAVLPTMGHSNKYFVPKE